MKEKIILFTRVPKEGTTKTRLYNFVQPKQAVEIQTKLLKKNYKLLSGLNKELFVFHDGNERDNEFMNSIIPADKFFYQRGENLGDKMYNAIKDVIEDGDKVILLGSDIANLSQNIIDMAFKNLNTVDIVINPSEDGGYFLIGMKKPVKEVFDLPSYGDNTVLENFITVIKNKNLSYYIGEVGLDIDTREDLLQAETGYRDIELLGAGEYNINFTFSDDGVIIANYTSQRTYYSETFIEKEKISLDDLKKWLDKWMKETTEEDLEEIEEFKNAKRKHCKFNEGDFFAFKISRREWCFGRILMDVSKLRKDENFEKNKNYGLAHLMGKPLIIKVYHKISDNKNIDLKELSKCLALPSQPIMDNIFYYGEAVILGNLPLKPEENDMFISVSESISGIDKNIAYLQYGLIYREIPLSDYEKLIKELKIGAQTLRREGIGFVIDTYN